MKRKKTLLVCVSLVLVFSLLAVAGCGVSEDNASETGKKDSGADFPNKPITILVHTKPGGPTDLMCRELAKAAEPILGQTIVVENRPGGSGATQMAALKSAGGDGYTVGSITSTHVGQWNSNLKGQFGVDDFSYVARVQIDPYIIVVHADSPFNNLQELVDYAKKNPGKLKVGGYGGVGSGHNIAWSIFAETADIETTWVPYDSTGEAVKALLGKHIDVANSNPGVVSQFVETGQLRILGVMSDERLQEVPDIPTYVEQGFDVDTDWIHFRGIYAPAGVPEEVLEKLSTAFLEAMQTEEFKKYMKGSGMLYGGMDHNEFTQFIQKRNQLTEKWLQKLGVQ